MTTGWVRGRMVGVLYDERASVVATLVVLGLILATVVHVPAWSQELHVLGSPLTIRLTETTMMGLALVGITCAGTGLIVRSHPRVRQSLQDEPSRPVHTFVTWTVPGLTTALATALVPRLPEYVVQPGAEAEAAARTSQLVQMGGMVVAGLALVLTISAVYVTLDPTDRHYSAARLLLNVWAYALALVTFAVIYSAKERSLVSATAVTAVSTLLALEILRGAGQGFGRTALYSCIAGLSTGEMVWAMNYMRIGGRTGGLLLLLGFYLATGVAMQALRGLLTRRVVVEYAAVAAVGLFVLLRWGP